VDDGDVGTAVVGLAGTPSEEIAQSVQAEFSPGAWYFVNDVIPAWASGTWLEPGVAAISGTGSHVFGVNGAGESWRTGGWGHVLGDEGSGYWLGRHGMKAALHYRDGSGPETALLDAAVAFYRLDAIEDLSSCHGTSPGAVPRPVFFVIVRAVRRNRPRGASAARAEEKLERPERGA